MKYRMALYQSKGTDWVWARAAEFSDTDTMVIRVSEYVDVEFPPLATSDDQIRALDQAMVAEVEAFNKRMQPMRAKVEELKRGSLEAAKAALAADYYAGKHTYQPDSVTVTTPTIANQEWWLT